MERYPDCYLDKSGGLREDFGRKNFINETRYEPRSQISQLRAQVLLHMCVLVINCYWCEFGEFQYRFDLRIPPNTIVDILTASV